MSALEPLSLRETITDSALYCLQTDECGARATGRLSDQDTAIMCMILPDFCGELIARRAVAYTPDEHATLTVTTDHLRRLARDTPDRATGTLTAAEHYFLARSLAAMCHELLHLRTLMSADRAA